MIFCVWNSIIFKLHILCDQQSKWKDFLNISLAVKLVFLRRLIYWAAFFFFFNQFGKRTNMLLEGFLCIYFIGLPLWSLVLFETFTVPAPSEEDFPEHGRLKIIEIVTCRLFNCWWRRSNCRNLESLQTKGTKIILFLPARSRDRTWALRRQTCPHFGGKTHTRDWSHIKPVIWIVSTVWLRLILPSFVWLFVCVWIRTLQVCVRAAWQMAGERVFSMFVRTSDIINSQWACSCVTRCKLCETETYRENDHVRMMMETGVTLFLPSCSCRLRRFVSKQPTNKQLSSYYESWYVDCRTGARCVWGDGFGDEEWAESAHHLAVMVAGRKAGSAAEFQRWKQPSRHHNYMFVLSADDYVVSAAGFLIVVSLPMRGPEWEKEPTEEIRDGNMHELWTLITSGVIQTRL